MTSSPFEVIELAPRIGAEIRTDIDTLLDGTRADDIRRALEERGVICFREVGLDDERQLAFSRTLGQVLPQGNKGVFTVSMDASLNPSPEIAEYQKGSVFWHFDTATDAVPTRASILSGDAAALCLSARMEGRRSRDVGQYGHAPQGDPLSRE